MLSCITRGGGKRQDLAILWALKYAWKVDTSEALSPVFLGEYGRWVWGIIEANTSDELYGLIMDIMPGMLSEKGGRPRTGCCPGPDDPQYNTLKTR